MYIVSGRTLPDAYHNALRTLFEFGCIVDAPSWETRCIEVPIAFIAEAPMEEPRISRLFPGGPRDLEKYRLEMLCGIEDFEVERGNWEYTYHERIAEQIPFIIRELQRDPYSRRAVIDVRRTSDNLLNDPPCLQHIQFVIRNGKLNMTVLFRSNDACKATFMNAYALTCLQEMVAAELGVDVGSYTHIANSFHAYERDWELLESYYNRICGGGELTYNFRGDWDELMDAERKGILEEVERMKRENKT